jgi:hypothetical protein
MECAQLFLCGAHSQQLFEPTPRVLERAACRGTAILNPQADVPCLGGIAEDDVRE